MSTNTPPKYENLLSSPKPPSERPKTVGEVLYRETAKDFPSHAQYPWENIGDYAQSKWEQRAKSVIAHHEASKEKEAPGPTCQTCNWTNCRCLNLAGPGEDPRWMCHGCIKRMADDLKAKLSGAEAHIAALEGQLRELVKRRQNDEAKLAAMAGGNPATEAQKAERPTDPLAEVKAAFAAGKRVQCQGVHDVHRFWSDFRGATPFWEHAGYKWRVHPDDVQKKRVPWDSTHDMPKVGSLWLRSKDDYRDHLVIGVANPCAIIMATCGSGPVIQSERFSDMRWDVMEWSSDRENWQPCSKEES